MNLAARIAPPQIHLALFIGRDLTQPEMKIRTTLSRVSAASIHLRDEYSRLRQMNSRCRANSGSPKQIRPGVSRSRSQRLPWFKWQKNVQAQKLACWR